MKDTDMLPLSRLLLPVKESELLVRSLPLVTCISKTMGEQLEKLELLHVIGGSFLSTHLNNIDFRAGHLLSSDLLKRLRDQHYKEIVSPLLVKVQEVMAADSDVLAPTVRVEYGDPVKKISAICAEEKFSTLIVARRKKTREESIAETVLTGILQQFLDATVYIVSERGWPLGKSPAARIMIGVDGSSASLRAAAEAALLVTRNSELVEEVALVNVRDPSCVLDGGEKGCQIESDKGYHYLQQAEELLLAQGVEQARISTILLFGRPGETITSYASQFSATLCFIGRRERSELSKFLLGSVCEDIIHRCRRTSLALVS